MNDHVVADVNVCVFVIPDTVIAFNANADVTANDDVPANREETELVYVLKSVVSNFPVPTA